MKKVLHLDQVLLPLWLAAAEVSCDGNLSSATIMNVTPLPRWRQPPPQATDPHTICMAAAHRYAYLGITLDSDDTRPRASAGVVDSSKVSVFPSQAYVVMQIPEALDFWLLGSRDQDRITRKRLGPGEYTPVTADVFESRQAVATSARWLFNIGDYLPQLVQLNDAEFLGADSLPQPANDGVVNIFGPGT